MKKEFEKWMVRREGKSPNTASQYKSSIDLISRHYSQQNKKSIDLYTINDILFIKSLVKDYGMGGRYQEIGQNGTGTNGHGTVRNAIATYARFLEYKKLGNKTSENSNNGKFELKSNSIENIEEDDDENLKINNFTYERDLKYSMVTQVGELFPGYKIFGKQGEGIEYTIAGKRIDLLLENTIENELLIIELKAGVADDNVLAQISNYYGLLSKEFPNKKIKGIIIAGEIDDSLIHACSITDKIEVKKYKMKLTLEKIV
jgi:predicted nuclease of restriction endonuclease-like (RecB) superfamily